MYCDDIKSNSNWSTRVNCVSYCLRNSRPLEMEKMEIISLEQLNTQYDTSQGVLH